jgi:glutathione S-transferase
MSWLSARPDRADLVRWLAIRNDTGGGGAFAARMLETLITTGALTAAQETAVRRARERVARREALVDPSFGGRADGKRLDTVECRVGV